MPSSDSLATDFLEDPTEPASLRQFEWRGKPLFPFSLDIRTVWMGLSTVQDHANFAAAAMIWALVRAQVAYEEAVAAKLDRETALDHVARIMMRAARDREAAGVTILRFMREELRTNAAAQECLKLAAAILDEAQKSEPESPADASGEGEVSSGKPQPAATRRRAVKKKSTRTR